jgi:hypothetical protein
MDHLCASTEALFPAISDICMRLLFGFGCPAPPPQSALQVTGRASVTWKLGLGLALPSKTDGLKGTTSCTNTPNHLPDCVSECTVPSRQLDN